MARLAAAVMQQPDVRKTDEKGQVGEIDRRRIVKLLLGRDPCLKSLDLENALARAFCMS